VLDDGQTRIAIVGLDVVGFLHDDIVDIRKALPGYLDIDYTIICSTHNHEGPDLVGIGAKVFLKSGVDPEYMEFVKKQTVTAIARAVENMRQAKLKFAQNLKDGANFVMDTRKPQEMDHGIRVIQAIDVETDTTLGSLISWGIIPKHFGAGICSLVQTFRTIYVRQWRTEFKKKPGIGKRYRRNGCVYKQFSRRTHDHSTRFFNSRSNLQEPNSLVLRLKKPKLKDSK
jgi:hypothetical protein